MFVPVLEKGWYANICFWYVPKRLRCRPHDTIWKAEIHKVAPLLKEKMMFEGTLMITFQPHKGMPNFWRAIGKLMRCIGYILRILFYFRNLLGVNLRDFL